MTANDETVIELRGVCTRFGSFSVHEGLDLDVRRGEVLAIVGGSGSGKTTLLHEMIMLRRPSAGSIRLFGEDVVDASPAVQARLRRRFGVLFQHGALFSGLTVQQNVGVPLHEHTDLDAALIDEIALLKIQQAGLPVDAALKYPSELSGGMIKRAALARAMALDPQLLFLDEPTSGLDPASASAFDELVLRLKQWLGLTVVMVTHDLDSLWRVADRVAVLGDRRVVAVAPMAELARVGHPAVRVYFEGPRARAAQPH
ncbi:MAG: ATP-binding cassette domain-containing protein [Gammaproteobacteria bacterium]|jgi:phospholipid/cholesterol/gamma-HCH transport system ATP-binding protein|nr:ATP-binding cassette domain-containing protein [Gammaproteobacteria bacterium]